MLIKVLLILVLCIGLTTAFGITETLFDRGTKSEEELEAYRQGRLTTILIFSLCSILLALLGFYS